MHFADTLTQRVKKTSPVCVGLDPDLSLLPDGISKDHAGVLQFNKGIIDSVKDIASCVKPQLAFYEVLGWEGIKVFWETCSYAKENGLLVIADGKRGDVESTAQAYARAYLYNGSPVDALTVHPYLGSDTLKPFLEHCHVNEKGIFILVKTSNPGSGEIQDLAIGDETVHEYLAQIIEGIGADHLAPESHLSCVGAVVGALYPEELKYLRTLMPHCPFLIPGYGAQGGREDDVRHGFIPDGTGAIVNSSRGIIYAGNGPDWKETVQKAAHDMACGLKSMFTKE
jgi:orotidine-5'-phosphate decarboxylase